MGERDDDGEQVFSDLRALKVPESEIAKLKAKHAGNARNNIIEVEPENRDAVRIFNRAMSQWRSETIVAGKHLLERHKGLDYAVLPTIAAALGIAFDERVFDAIRVMEGVALQIYVRRQEEYLRRQR
jgi:hypothetical protein